ncbi:MAG: hypothetical protein AYK22_01960 [Thermoplasmatales archaeon SG8-52-3]|nr:MAG: hypothetical protein AYK22_01960 [Thermoplasmatales archaeon SG8-52-3]
MISELEKKEIDQNTHANNLINNLNLLQEYLDGLISKNETYRYNCFKVLFSVSEKKPDIIYPYWDFFINHLDSKNSYHKMSAVLILANLTAVDTEKKFETIFEKFYDNLKSEKTIVPIYVIKSSGKILKFKPNLEGKITDLLINIEKIHQGKQIELLKSAVIESFTEFFPNSKNKLEIINFVQEQIKSSSPKTRKIAKDFLKNFVGK